MQWLVVLVMMVMVTPAYAQLSVVEAAKKRHPTLANNPAETVAANREIAAVTGGGLYKKSGGNTCLGYSCDWICWPGDKGRDVWGSWESKAIPMWPKETSYLEDTATRCELVPPQLPPNWPPTEPPTQPPTQPGSYAELIEEVKKLNALLTVIAAQQGAQTQAVVAATDALRAEVAKGIKVRF